MCLRFWQKIMGRSLAAALSPVLREAGMVSMKTAYIDMIVVDEKNIAEMASETLLFQAVQKRAKQMGARRIDLMVWNHNQIAIEAYESYGMRPQRCVYEKSLS